MQDLYTEKYKVLLKEDPNKWIAMPHSETERLNEMSILFKLINRFNVEPIKIATRFP